MLAEVEIGARDARSVQQHERVSPTQAVARRKGDGAHDAGPQLRLLTGEISKVRWRDHPKGAYCVAQREAELEDERLVRLESKLDALMVALRAGAIGKWTP